MTVFTLDATNKKDESFKKTTRLKKETSTAAYDNIFCNSSTWKDEAGGL